MDACTFLRVAQVAIWTRVQLETMLCSAFQALWHALAGEPEVAETPGSLALEGTCMQPSSNMFEGPQTPSKDIT